MSVCWGPKGLLGGDNGRVVETGKAQGGTLDMLKSVDTLF